MMAQNKLNVAYDTNSKPPSLHIDEVLRVYEETGMLIYDASRGVAPIPMGNVKMNPTFLDIKNATDAQKRKLEIS